MGHHALGSAEIWNNGKCNYIFLMNSQICTCTQVVALDQSTPMPGKTLFWGTKWRRADTKFSVPFKGGGGRGQKIFKAAQENK